jgi:hypothetical protein
MDVGGCAPASGRDRRGGLRCLRDPCNEQRRWSRCVRHHEAIGCCKTGSGRIRWYRRDHEPRPDDFPRGRLLPWPRLLLQHVPGGVSVSIRGPGCLREAVPWADLRPATMPTGLARQARLLPRRSLWDLPAPREPPGLPGTGPGRVTRSDLRRPGIPERSCSRHSERHVSWLLHQRREVRVRDSRAWLCPVGWFGCRARVMHSFGWRGDLRRRPGSLLRHRRRW